MYNKDIVIVDHVSLIKRVTIEGQTNLIKMSNILNLYRHRNRRLSKIKKIFGE